MHTPSVSPRMLFKDSCAYTTGSLPRSRFRKSSFDPYSEAPGRISARAAAISSSVRAFMVRNSPRIPGDSIWKTPMVRPSAMTAQVAGSFSGITAKSMVRAFGQGVTPSAAMEEVEEVKGVKEVEEKEVVGLEIEERFLASQTPLGMTKELGTRRGCGCNGGSPSAATPLFSFTSFISFTS